MKSYMRNRLVPKWMIWPLFSGRIKVTSTTALHLTLNISVTITDRGLVLITNQQEMAYGLSNGRVTDDVTLPWKVKLVTPICLEPNISKTAGFRDSVPKTTNRKWPMGYQMSRDQWRHVTPKVLWGSMVGYPSESFASCLNLPFAELKFSLRPDLSQKAKWFAKTFAEPKLRS